jgi:hypothetical protein
MNIIPRIADAMQTVLTTTADITARETGFVQRQRKLSGSVFAQTLVFGWLANPDASLGELTQTTACLGVNIAPQALDQRFTYQASEFLKKTLENAVGALIAAEPVAIPILQRFNGVHIQDSSVITLPDELSETWQGCGGSAPKNTSASVKIQVRLNMNTGQLSGPYLQPGKQHDRSSCLQEKQLPQGALHIADLGYFSLKRLKSMKEQGVFWLSRIRPQCVLYDQNGKKWDLVEFLTRHCDGENPTLDVPILLGADKRIPCRLLAVRVPEQVVSQRRGKIKADARRRGVKPSKRQLALAQWTVLVTWVPPELLSLDEAFVLMRIRWQIELLFKLWKSSRHIDHWRSKKPLRILCELYAKLLVMVIQHWILLSGCWQHPNRSLHKAAQTIRKHAMHLAIALSSGRLRRLHEALEIIQRCLSAGCRLNKRKKNPNTYQLLLQLSETGLT